MYVNGNSPFINAQDTEVELFLKFGLGSDYYEITQPVYKGWDEDENRNSLNIDLNWLTQLKQSDTTRINKFNPKDDSIEISSPISSSLIILIMSLMCGRYL